MADEQKGTVYVVLRQATRATTATHQNDEQREVPLPGTYTVIEQDGKPMRFAAPNDIAAIKMAEQELGQNFDHGAVAVPVRSWRPRAPKDEMVPRRLWT